MQLSLSDQCTLLRYNLRRNKKDVLGNIHKYATYPSDGNGGINYFDSDDEITRWIQNVNDTRRITGDGTTILDFITKED